MFLSIDQYSDVRDMVSAVFVSLTAWVLVAFVILKSLFCICSSHSSIACLNSYKVTVSIYYTCPRLSLCFLEWRLPSRSVPPSLLSPLRILRLQTYRQWFLRVWGPPMVYMEPCVFCEKSGQDDLIVKGMGVSIWDWNGLGERSKHRGQSGSILKYNQKCTMTHSYLSDNS